MTIASGGTTLSIGGAMAVAATGEAAQQGTLLVATAVEGKSTLTAADYTNAALEVAIAGGTAGLGAYAKKIASHLLPIFCKRPWGVSRPPRKSSGPYSDSSATYRPMPDTGPNAARE